MPTPLNQPLPRRFARAVPTAALLVALAADVGCHRQSPYARYHDPEAPPPIAVVTTTAPPSTDKPLPPQDDGTTVPPGFSDPAIVRTQMAEEPRYVAAYVAVNRPKLLVFVNRTVTGALVPVNTTAVARPGLAPVTDGGVVLQPGQYDEAQARSIDYELLENLLAEDLAADGKVTIIAPLSARQRLSDAEVSDIQAGRPQMLGELATKLNADVLIQVTARPSVQTAQGLGIRLVAQALNTHGGQAVAFAAVDVPPPLTKPVMNEYVRFVARKLMEGMSGSWEAMVAPSPAPPTPAAPAAVAPLPSAVPPPAIVPPMVPPTPAAPTTEPSAAPTLAPAISPFAAPPVPTTAPAPQAGPTTALSPARSRPSDLPPPP